MIKKYYYEGTFMEYKFSTLWNGFLRYIGIQIPISSDHYQESNRELDDLLAETCDINFYVSLINNHIYMSICRDSNYYAIDFEKNTKKMIREIEKKFNVMITDGEFYANEIKHNGNQYKYNILKDNEDKIILKKKTLNFNIDNELIKKVKKLNI